MSAHARLRVESILSALRADQALVLAAARMLTAIRIAERLHEDAECRPALKRALRRWRDRIGPARETVLARLTHLGPAVDAHLHLVWGEPSPPGPDLCLCVYARGIGRVCALADLLADR